MAGIDIDVATTLPVGAGAVSLPVLRPQTMSRPTSPAFTAVTSEPGSNRCTSPVASPSFGSATVMAPIDVPGCQARTGWAPEIARRTSTSLD